ncbi:MAG: peptidoglycan-binding protein [Chloroflexi bacterium]|nr:MAG: peptidoglycan-binding protein [Chloroflexota bacterium]MBL1192821.1 peptidoglycan-binding protein [Chloroflexota bacterium]NOH10114.1 peptidoglycan-binding protein [Chloroflexota bacterium]
MTPPPPPTPTLTPTPEPIVNAWPIVKQGDTGAEVTALQHLLRSYGYVLVVDGNFGPQTKNRVQGFQMTEGLTVDGIVGPDTWSALISGKTVQNGSIGDAVRAAQSLLVNKFGAGIAVDGTFGPLTESAVEDFQTANFLLVDGIIGPQTWQALISN